MNEQELTEKLNHLIDDCFQQGIYLYDIGHPKPNTTSSSPITSKAKLEGWLYAQEIETLRAERLKHLKTIVL